MAFEPITTETVPVSANREPVFSHPAQSEAGARKLAELERRTGRKPNILIVLMDDVGWGDFGCYGGGVAVGAPTPNIDRLARQGMQLTSCYSEPSCSPSRATLLTGRVPNRHGLHRPPMYGEPGGLEGEVSIAQLLSESGYVTRAVGQWHVGENLALAFSMLRNEQDATDVCAGHVCARVAGIGQFQEQLPVLDLALPDRHEPLHRFQPSPVASSIRAVRDGVDPKADASVEQAPSNNPSPTAELERGDLRAQIDAAMRELSEDHRAVIQLREYENLDYAEMARVLGCNIGTVMSRLHYARKHLQRLLKEVI